MTLHLTQTWAAAPEGTFGTLVLTLHNQGESAIKPTRFCYTALARIDDTTQISGGTLTRNLGSFVEVVPNADIPAGGTWELRLTGLIYGVRTRTQGALTAWVISKDGSVIEATVEDICSADGLPRGARKDWPTGEIEVPLGVLPWPSSVAITAWSDQSPKLYPANDKDKAVFQTVSALHRRLFPTDPTVLSLVNGLPVMLENDASLPTDGYKLSFADDKILLAHHGDTGAQHGLIALAQMAHSARTDQRFKFPAKGEISDAPRFAWRGVMLDAARNFHSLPTHLRLLDIMAWMRMNRFHWHLIDDEGWRMPSKAYPALNEIGASRHIDGPIPPQYRDGPDGQSGFYSATNIAQLLGHADALGIQVMPEVEMPGHAASLIASIPGLRDKDEPNNIYRSVQGFTNNALNPGLALSYEVAETLLDEAIELFPFDTIHVGADEVEISAWQNSPAAQAFAKEKGLNNTHEMQAYFLKHVQSHLGERGRRIAAWDEAAEGGGIAPDNALLFAWRTKEKTAELLSKGYDVIATPGQAYYLDMIEFDGWDANGISWAGISTPYHSYTYEVSEGLPEGPGQLIGVQAAIWSEYFDTPERINALAFPRIAAVAEAGWTDPSQKSWPRFAALSRLMPQL